MSKQHRPVKANKGPELMSDAERYRLERLFALARRKDSQRPQDMEHRSPESMQGER